jgi:hypothetical protein
LAENIAIVVMVESLPDAPALTIPLARWRVVHPDETVPEHSLRTVQT